MWTIKGAVTMENSRAVVIGSGVAGLLAAQALSEIFASVVVVERDRIAQWSAHRAGVPQDRHVHTLWAGGMQAIERFLPGISGELVAAGGCSIDFFSEFAWLLPAGRWQQAWPATQSLVSSTRPLLENTIRQRVQKTTNIEIVDGHEVCGLRLGTGGAVDGVEFVARGGESASSTIEADFVIDAGGRRSGLTEWLAAHGLPAPSQSTVDPSIGYATRLYRIPAGHQAPYKGMYIQLAPPEHTRGGIMFHIEDDQWVVTLLGACRDYPPTDEAGYLDFAASLRSPRLSEIINDAEPSSPIFGYRHTANHRRHYEKLTGMPAGLIALGDSLCAFNPIYGQGMTVAALQVSALSDLLRAGMRSPADAKRLSRRAQRVMARVADQAWMISASEDLRYPVTGGPKGAARFLHAFMDRVMLAATMDEKVANTFLAVLNMVAKPSALFRPGMVLRIVNGARRAS
jgi:2-polyprenyl-6-methoxyphenol hydroxylase-like FAD-dependent oxidoreductase